MLATNRTTRVTLTPRTLRESQQFHWLSGQPARIVGYHEERRPREVADDGADSVAWANRWPTAIST